MVPWLSIIFAGMVIGMGSTKDNHFFQLCHHVDYIQNKKLEEQFLAQKKMLQQAGKQDGEVMLWHATRFFEFHKPLR